ncbi:peptidoglycan-binding domain-containing protein [Glycomyces buryatensis]|uniref:Peptidoglycan-binding protein n=1 Tax=Glycomyces buryatensis TaxID=2570927 RepID=A0A4S8QFT4_9ACTN|nr:peptidoglycan-binding domain-containing protein [Glycomyces buryatensis]THV43567.1 peptidoglycan-binding protein [Glycomyces buryatensis]
MAWRLAKSLVVLRSEINAAAPGRSTASDGTIGDDAHQGTASDHNPNGSNVVCAADFTHHPGSGADMHQFAEHLRRANHRDIKYIIWNKRIWSKSRAGEGWRSYGGSNPHTRHMHVSVGVGSDGQSRQPYDDTSSWGIQAKFGGGELIGLKRGDTGDRVKGLQGTLRFAGYDPGSVDGNYGSKTAAAVLKMRRAEGSDTADGNNFTGWAYAQLMRAMAKKY